jgi:hypothetical protein
MIDSAIALSSWQNFYVIVGSSGGALIGLQFVVITLIAGRRNIATAGALAAFGTPTVVHLTGALLVSAVMSAPWGSLGPLSAAVGIGGIAGLAYGAIVIRRAQRQTDYQPVREDWIWHAVLPFVSYTALAVSAALLHVAPRCALFVIAAVALALLLIGIHNAWDTVTHVVLTGAGADPAKPD